MIELTAKINTRFQFRWIVFFTILVASCGKPFVKNAPKNKYISYKNKIDIKADNISLTEKKELTNRLSAQLDDSAKVTVRKKLIFFKIIRNPLVFDTSHVRYSIDNMKASLFHLGYYHPIINYQIDTGSKKRITVRYNVTTGKTTRIKKVTYNFSGTGLSTFEKQFSKNSLLVVNKPITKTAVLNEINRLVDSFRNNGFYKFTAAELKIRGDTLLKIEKNSTANEPNSAKRNTINLEININKSKDSSRLVAYTINKIFIQSNFIAERDSLTQHSIHYIESPNFTFIYRDLVDNYKIFDNLLAIKPGNLFRQQDYDLTLNNFSKLGIWQSINIQALETDSSHINVTIELNPSNKFRFETSLEVSYSASNFNSNVLAGNLFGLSTNISLLNRNLSNKGVKMMHNVRAGIEFNNKIGANTQLINSNEVSYSNNTSFPKLIFPSLPSIFNKTNNINKGETFINFDIAYNTRLNLFNLQTTNASFGWTGKNKYNWKWAWSPLKVGFSNLFNESDSFKNILRDNAFLKYSYNTALVGGMGINFSKNITNLKHPNSLAKEVSLKFNAEESGLSWGLIPLLNKYKRRYLKGDFETKYSIKYNKTAFVLRGFLGIGIPLLGIDSNKTLPFFKQYFAGGSNSMRGWPVRGIGPGGSQLNPFSSNKTIFNDRTGDMQLELNAEYRYEIAKIIPNTLTLRGAVFTDIGNIWNIKNTRQNGISDSTVINFKTFYQQIGVAAGTGFRLDFNYFILRLDFGFRFKRPELFYINNGWKAPNIGFDNLLKKIFVKGDNDEYRKWRYENFNFTIGIGYAF